MKRLLYSVLMLQQLTQKILGCHREERSDVAISHRRRFPREIAAPSSRARNDILWVFPIALLTALLLGACETVVDVKPPPHEDRLVAQSFFTPDSLWVVRVTHTVGYTSPESPGFVDDATVEIWEEGHLRAQVAWADSGTYAIAGSGPVMDQRYTLRVSAPGYPSLEGSDALPRPVPVTAFNETIVQSEDTTSRRQLTRLKITLDDPPDVANYYGLMVVQARWLEDRAMGQVTPLPPSLFIFESDDLALGEGEFDFLDTEKTLYREAFFTDGLFNGSTYTLDFDVQYDTPDPNADVVVRRVLAVVLLSVSEDFFRYWKTAGRQSFSNENPFAEPLRVHSNLTGGFGVFAGFQYRVFPLGASTVNVAGYGLSDLCGLVGSTLPICGAGPPVR